MTNMTNIDLDKLPALTPPPGVTPNFVNPYSQGRAIFITTGICVGFVTPAVTIRVFTKAYVIKRVNLEDYLLISAYIAFLVGIIFFVKEVPFGAGTHQWDVSLSKFFHLLGLFNASQTIYAVQILLAKLSVLFQMKRLLTGTNKNFIYWAFICMLIVNSAFYVAAFFLEIFACAPRAKIFNPLLPGTCLDAAVGDLVAAVFNFVSDVLMLLLPLYAIWKLDIVLKTKVGICAVFATGALACILSGLRILFGQMLINQPDITFVSIKATCVSAGEAAGIMLVATFPTLPRFLKFIRGKDLTTNATSTVQTFSSPRSSFAKSTQLKPLRALVGGVARKQFWPAPPQTQPPATPKARVSSADWNEDSSINELDVKIASHPLDEDVESRQRYSKPELEMQKVLPTPPTERDFESRILVPPSREDVRYFIIERSQTPRQTLRPALRNGSERRATGQRKTVRVKADSEPMEEDTEFF